jgi:NADH-quinone oxidoreductase subunit F
VSTILIPELSAYWDEPDSFRLAAYKRTGGYEALPKALALQPDQVIQALKDSALRGRGGAGFPTGNKWGFIPQGDGKPHYLVVNADESEPGACKDIPTLLANPQALIEGIIITCYAIRADKAFIYVRGEVLHVARRLQLAVAEAYEAGYLGERILGSDLTVDVVVHSGAGAYICGEETALLDSLEGFRGQPRLKPPFPAVAGLYACPTVVNNVESIATVPYILQYGAAEFTRFGTERSKGFGLFSLSGHVTTPGQYEAPLGTTLRELLGLAGGMRHGNQLKFWTPGGSSTPLFTDQHLDVPLDYESVAAAGSMLGTRSVQLFDETTCVVRVVLRWVEFYQHESCGKCTPCREGSWWVVQLLRALEHGESSTPNGVEADLEKLLDICENITGRAFCALGDSIQAPVASSIKYFRDEYIEHQRNGGCPFDPAASTLFALESAR